MTLPAFKTVAPSDDYVAMTMENNIQQALGPVLKIPMLDYVLLTSINLTANIPMTITHKLGRQPQGWLVTDNYTVSGAGASVGRNAWTQITITLTASATCTLALWVF